MSEDELRRQLQQAREELARLKERLDMARRFARLGLWERDVVSGRGRWDDELFAIYGIEPAAEAPSLDRIMGMMHPEDAAQISYPQSWKQPGQHEKRFRVVRPDGSMRWVRVHWTSEPGPDGTPTRSVGMTIDDTEVIEMARSLGDASAQLKLAVDLGNIAIWRHDLRSDRFYYNDRAFAILGIAPRPEGLPIEEVRSLIHPDDVPHVIESARIALTSDRPTDMEARYRRSDGSWRYVLTRRVVQRDAAGEPQAFVGVALDVTEQVEKQREAARLAKRLETTAAAAGIGIWSVDIAADIRQWNPQMFVLVGRDPSCGLPDRHEWWGRIVHPDDREAMQRHQEELLRTEGEMREHVFRVVRPDGQVRWLVDRALCEVVDGRRVLHGVSLDLTEQRRVELALREANERAALAARGAGIGTWLYDVDTGAAQWDEQMWRLRGLRPRTEAPSAEERLALVHPDDRARLAQQMGLRDTRARPLNTEFRVVWPDGQVRWLASRSVPVLETAGQPRRIVGVNWDVTEARNAEAARQEKALAERESQAKSQFLARMSHELRTPLNAVLGFAQLLEHEEGQPIGEPQLGKLGHIRRAGEHLLALIDDVLDLTRLESGQLPLQLRAVPVARLVAEALPLVAPAAAERDVRLEAHGPSALAHVDRKRALQVLLNLLTNAIKYNRRGGTVRVESGTVDRFATLDVIDTGRGLDPDELSHLFEPFNRLHAQHGDVEGTGIGLVIVKALVERMGGRLEVHSERGVGSRFRVYWPLADEATARPITAPAPLQPLDQPNRRGKLLYIEDNPVNVMLVEEIVRSLPGLEFAAEGTGLAGLQRALEMRPGLILLDMQLPDIGGEEVLARLRQDAATASIPCIAVSANAMPEDIERARSLGFADYWTKPIDVARFRIALAKRFESSSG